jgi:DivIVA domain-containing protein
MALTPADVHNVAFSRPRIGKRGYNEQELTRHLTADAQLRNLNGERRQQKAGLAEREAKLGQQGTPLPRQIAQLRHREARVAQREAQLEQREAELAESQTHQQAVASRVGAENVAKQLRTAPQKSAPVNGTPRLEEVRALASVEGRHDIERIAIRAITDTVGNTVTETVHERTRRSRIDHGGQAVAVERSTELEQLKEENAELAHFLGLLKSAAALLAAALDRT